MGVLSHSLFIRFDRFHRFPCEMTIPLSTVRRVYHTMTKRREPARTERRLHGCLLLFFLQLKEYHDNATVIYIFFVARKSAFPSGKSITIIRFCCHFIVTR